MNKLPSLQNLKSASLLTIGTALLGSVSFFLESGDYQGAMIAAGTGFGIFILKYKLGL